MPLVQRIPDLVAPRWWCLLAAFVVSASELDAQASAGVVTIKGRIRDEADTSVVVARARTPVGINDNGITFRKCQVSLNGVSLVPAAGRTATSLMPPSVQVYVDGNRLTRLGSDDANEILKSIHPSSIEAIEVYTGVARIPAEFLNDACAVIAIWTR